MSHHSSTTNRLIHATSPYLLQHAHNPVDWYEWGEEALEKAKKEDKPILVSIGYSSCHWCHVMERESFENEDIAQVMNEFFVCIKVDREERPDIDQIYMEAVQALGLNGGWPLNVFLTPDQKPFYGGTYYPPQSWVQLLQNINNAYQTKREQIESTAEELTKVLSRSDLERFKTAARETELKADLQAIFSKMSSSFDTTWGGMVKAPKFVMPSSWMLMLRHHFLTKDQHALDQVKTTLDRVAMGGIHDQLAGGFARYSVDGEWFAPHFEKMLYDNAQLMSLYAEAYAVTGNDEYRRVIRSIFDWINSEMTHPQGGFYSALDADSEGVEGKFYVWTKEEIDSLLGDSAPLISSYYSVTDTGNWEHGNNILIRRNGDETFLDKHNLSTGEWSATLGKAKKTLLTAREQRVRPGLDDKIITSWNALMIVGLTDAYRATGDGEYLDAAVSALEFVENNLMNGKVLKRSFKGKASSTTGFLDDYAFLIHAYLKLYQVSFNEDYLENAQELTEYSIEHFHDEVEGFFFYTSAKNEELISRKKEIFDNVIPSSNSMMARNLFLLGTVSYRPEWKAMAETMIASVGELILSEPHYMSNWAIALLESKTPLAEVAFVGPEAMALASGFHEQYYPFALSLGTRTASSIPLLLNKEPVGGQTTIYVCFEGVCKLPVHTLDDAEAQIAGSLKAVN